MYNIKSAKIINPEKLPTIHIIGVGGTGSFLAFQLAKLGVEDMHLYDFDKVEAHNVGNQLFGRHHIGRKKVEATQEIILDNTGIKPYIHDRKINLKTAKFNGIVFVLTDTMNSRREIMEANMHNFQCELIIETRLGIFESRVYALDPRLPNHTTEYSKTLLRDEDIQDDPSMVSACGTRQDLVASSNLLASLAIMKLIHWSDINNGNREDQIVNELILGYKNSLISIENTWE